MNLPRHLRTSLLLSLALLGSVAGCWAYVSWGRPTVYTVKRMLGRSGLGPGSTRAEVVAWLDAQGVEYAPEEDPSQPGGYPAQESPLMVGRLTRDDVGGVIVARFRDAVVYPSNPWWHGELWAYFFFAKGGNLIKYEVKDWPGYF